MWQSIVYELNCGSPAFLQHQICWALIGISNLAIDDGVRMRAVCVMATGFEDALGILIAGQASIAGQYPFTRTCTVFTLRHESAGDLDVGYSHIRGRLFNLLECPPLWEHGHGFLTPGMTQ